jgi:hypothetical protein
MYDQAKATPELVEALTKSDAIANAIACRLTHDDNGQEGFREEIALLEEIAAEADAELERVRREHGLES